LGLTNFDAAHLRVVLTSGIPIVCNQVGRIVIDIDIGRHRKKGPTGQKNMDGLSCGRH
jgi:hypothetical protein